MKLQSQVFWGEFSYSKMTGVILILNDPRRVELQLKKIYYIRLSACYESISEESKGKQDHVDF